MTRDEARRLFPGQFRRALARKGMKQMDLAALMGVRATTISEWARGIRFPEMGQVAGLIEHMDGDTLAAYIVAGHTVQCLVCDRSVVQLRRSRSPKYCSRVCKSTARDRVRRDSRAQEGLISKRRLTMHQDAVAAFCSDCTLGDGVCRDDGCHLRPVSPLPFVALTRARVA